MSLTINGLRLPLSDFDLALDLEADTGLTVLTGRSGSGKTSLLETIAGLRRPAAGRIALRGNVLSDGRVETPPRDRRVAYAPQDDTVFPHLSVQQNLAYGLARGPGALARQEVLEELRLTPLLARRPRLLSGGERRRVALARALLPRADLLLLDEPFTGLDAELRGRVVRLALRACASMPALLVTHDLDELSGLGLRTLVLEDGRLRSDH